MIAFGILVGLIAVEGVLRIRASTGRNSGRREASIVWIIVAAVFLSLTLAGLIDWGFRWYGLGVLLAVRALLGAVYLLRRDAPAGYAKSGALLGLVGRMALFGLATTPLLLFPPYTPLALTGSHAVGTSVFTWTDATREDSCTPGADRRKISVQLWYPAVHEGEDAPVLEGIFPLAVFSHGAFGYRMSNHSTFMELASNGYVVASIDHTHQAIITKEADGTAVPGDRAFISAAMQVENGAIQGEDLYRLQGEWMTLRTADMSFVLDQIRLRASSPTSAAVFHHVDIGSIGVLGHSMGGATAAWLGRNDPEVDAVIVLDGTMMGEIVGFGNGKELLSEVPYPKPVLNLFGEEHYREGAELGDGYSNMKMHANAPRSFQLVVEGAGHLNFTDLPIVSPVLAGMLGTGTVDARACMETTNRAVLEFLDYYIKGKGRAIPEFRSL